MQYDLRHSPKKGLLKGDAADMFIQSQPSLSYTVDLPAPAEDSRRASSIGTTGPDETDTGGSKRAAANR